MTTLTVKQVLIVVPAYNEEKSIGGVLRTLRDCDLNVLVVSDGSTDGTVDCCRTFDVAVLELPFNLGVGGALRAGFQVAIEQGYEAIVQVDADGQHPISHIGSLINCSNADGAHMVIGSRFASRDTTMKVSGIRQFAMRLLAVSASRVVNSQVTDSSSGFRLIRRPLLDQLSMNLSSSYLGDTYESIISAGRAGYIVREVPAPMTERYAGTSSASTAQALQAIAKALGIFILHLHTRLSPCKPSNNE